RSSSWGNWAWKAASWGMWAMATSIRWWRRHQTSISTRTHSRNSWFGEHWRLAALPQGSMALGWSSAHLWLKNTVLRSTGCGVSKHSLIQMACSTQARLSKTQRLVATQTALLAKSDDQFKEPYQARDV